MKLPQSPRLTYRLISRSDEDRALLEILDTNPINREFFPGGVLSTDGVVNLQERFVSNYERDETPVFLVFDELRIYIGRVGLFYTDELNAIGIGYFVDHDFWGKGYAFEMTTALLDWTSSNTEFKEVFAYADINNLGSVEVMKKVGMEYVYNRVLKGIECVLYRKIL